MRGVASIAVHAGVRGRMVPDNEAARCDCSGTAVEGPIGILNGFGRSLGDAIVGLQALHVAIRIGAVPRRPVLFRLPGLSPMVEAVHAAAEFAEIDTLPWDFATRERSFDLRRTVARVVDIRDFAFDPDFRSMAMVDFFLRRLDVAPEQVPGSWRRNSWLASRVQSTGPVLPPGYILICPRASTRLRDMPEEIHIHILRRALAVAPVVTQGRVPDRLARHVTHAAPCATLADLCGLVRHAQWVISTDTGMVHLADALGVPCLAFFPTHQPESRVRDYPHCMPIALPSRLPPGIEFARGASDYALTRCSWFPHGSDLGWLDHALAQGHHGLLRSRCRRDMLMSQF